MQCLSRRLASGVQILGVVFITASLLSAQNVDYLRDIKPLLANHCYACHGALKQEGGLRLDTALALHQGGDSGQAIDVTDASKSSLLVRVSAQDPQTRMPPEGKPLSSEEIARLTQWIRSGATGPNDELPQKDPLSHWAFQPPQAQLPPAYTSAENPIDGWLAKKARDLGVVPLGQASKRETDSTRDDRFDRSASHVG